MSFRSRLRPLKRVAARALERLWRPAFAAAGYGVGQRPALWTSRGGGRILIVAPHPDDEAIGCAGTVLAHVAACDRVWVAIATDGRRSRSAPDPQTVAAQRRAEAQAAAQLMQVERLEWLGFAEGDWSTTELAARLASLIEEFGPDVVYAPSRIDFHPEHLKVAHALALALNAAARRSGEITIRIYPVSVPLTPRLVNLVADVSGVMPRCRAILAAYASQAASIECTYRQRRYGALLHRMSGEIEEFWQLPVERYVRLHREPPSAWPLAFRGMRNFPLSDPLAYLVGSGARRQLQASG
jgi:LmbE family N-acetylglucosaminyl deacetylase